MKTNPDRTIKVEDHGKYRVIEIRSVVRANESQRILNDITQHLGGEGITLCEIHTDIREITADEIEAANQLLAE